MIIRKAVESDAPAIARFVMMAESELVAMMFGSDNPDALVQAITPLVLSPIPSRYSIANTLTAEVDGRVAGAAIAFPADSQPAIDKPLIAELNRHGHNLNVLFFEGIPGTYYLSSMGVEPDFRGRGLGSRLMAACEEEGKRRGFDRASLLVSKEKAKAKELYERRGYQAVEEVTIAGYAYVRMARKL